MSPALELEGGAAAHAADFGGLPSSASTKKSAGLRGKNGNLAAPSESGLGLFVDKDGGSLLRLSVQDVDVNAREVQANLELIKLRLEQVGFSGKTPIWNAAGADVQRATGTLAKYGDTFVAQVAPGKQGEARALLQDGLAAKLPDLLEATRAQNYGRTAEIQTECAEAMAKVRELMAMQKIATSGPFFATPAEYAGQPSLEGRAKVQLQIKTGGKKQDVVVVVDGFHAPLAAGAFVNQAVSGAYDGLPVAYGEELIVGMQKPKKNGDLTVPLELFYRGDVEPSYGSTQDEDGRGSDTQVLPFQAFGALGMSHPDEDNDGGSAGQFFFVKYDQGLMPPGRNTLDGAYTCFGYTVDGSDALKTLTAGDSIVKATVLEGSENLRNPTK